MRTMLAFAVLVSLSMSFSLPSSNATPDLPAIDRWLQAGDRDAFDEVVEIYRSRGQGGLDSVIAMRSGDGLALPSGTAARSRDVTSRRLDELIDAVGGQKYCSVSRLYWHTDFEKAKHAAQETGKPILSLRMLGKLTEDLSCANSRFFRTTLYANNEVSDFLRGNFVLHWKSVRPVPVVTIAFGDGRLLRRTLTGNSAHYILSAEGDVIDALPGLYGPADFVDGLKRAREAASVYREAGFTQNSASRIATLRHEDLQRYHAKRLDAIATAWSINLAKASKKLGRDLEPVKATSNVAPGADKARKDARPQSPPDAVAAGEIATSKGSFEMPLLRHLVATPTRARLSALDAATDEPLWKAMAEVHRSRVKLDGRSRKLIARHHPPAPLAALVAVTKAVVETPLLRMMRGLQENIALDSVRNEYLLHRQIHEWLMNAGDEPITVDRLNERVYDELFLTPDTDPWLGLMQPDVYCALPNGGIIPATSGEDASHAQGK